MKPSEREPEYLHTEQEAADKSPRARELIETRRRLNSTVDAAAAENAFVKRFFNLDHNAYLEGPLPAKMKELMGLSVSAALRCDDCIHYHVIQSWRIGATRGEQEETLAPPQKHQGLGPYRAPSHGGRGLPPAQVKREPHDHRFEAIRPNHLCISTSFIDTSTARPSSR